MHEGVELHQADMKHEDVHFMGKNSKYVILLNKNDLSMV